MRVAVVGGGLAGLTAAHLLSRAGAHVVVLEGSPRLGGKLRREQVGDLTLDVGAESILARRPEGLDLISRLGLDGDVVHPSLGQATVWTRGALRPLPRSVMGVPADLGALSASGILAELPRGHSVPVPDEDVSVRAFLEPRVGAEVVDRLVEPLLGGVYAGHSDQLSVRAAAPQVLALGADPLAAALATEPHAPGTPVFAGLRGGVGRLVETLAEDDAFELRLDAPVRVITRTGSGWELAVGPTSAIETITADAVVVATPAPATARLLAETAPAAAFALAGLDYASMAIVTLVVDGPLAAEGSGFLVPPVDATTIKASTFSSQKWPWLAEQAGGASVLRASIGRRGETAILHQDDESIVALAAADLRAAIGDLPSVVASHVQRWGGALPQYDVGHLDLVEGVEAAVAAVPGLEVCGAAYRGIGIPAVIASATAAVDRVLAPGKMDA